eukprot:6737106-Pyramimonas_sp.AAC.1
MEVDMQERLQAARLKKNYFSIVANVAAANGAAPARAVDVVAAGRHGAPKAANVHVSRADGVD